MRKIQAQVVLKRIRIR